MTAIPPTLQPFLPRFFASDNVLQWDRIIGPGAEPQQGGAVRPWLQNLDDAECPVILPRPRHDGRVSWYILPRTRRQAREVRDLLLAFIGPTYSDFTGQSPSSECADPVDASVQQLLREEADSFVDCYQLTVPATADRNTVETNLLRLRQLIHRPHRGAVASRSVGRVLRDFEFALQASRWIDCESLLGELRDGGRLESQNLAHLKVRLLAARQAWADVLAMPETRSLVLAQRRPLRVTEALLQAVYQVHLASFEHSVAPAEAIRRFRETVRPEYGSLFHIRQGLRSVDAIKAMAVAFAEAGNLEPGTADELLAALATPSPDRTWVESLLAQSAPRASFVTASPEARAREAYHSGDYQTTLDLLRDCPPNREVLESILMCANDINTLAAAQTALKSLESAGNELRAVVLSRRTFRRLFDDLQELAAPSPAAAMVPVIPSNWKQWLEQVDAGNWPRALEVAQIGGHEWSVQAYLNNPSLSDELAQSLLAPRDPEAVGVLRNALPYLVESFLVCKEGTREFKPIYLALTDLLVMSDDFSAGDCEVTRRLADAGLSCGLTDAEYEQLLTQLEFVWGRIRSANQVDKALDLLDLLAAHAVHLRANVKPLTQQIVGDFVTWARRVATSQWTLLQWLCAELDQSELYQGSVVATVAEMPPETDRYTTILKGKTVAVYTMNERVGAQVAAGLERLLPGVRVQLCHDDVGTTRLRQLAWQADVFVLNTWDATHAATGFVRQYRSEDRVTVFPTSKTATSMLKSVLTWVNDQTE